MPKLLVSVRDTVETEACIAGPVDILDIKEPLRGSLGAPDSAVALHIAAVAAGQLELSIALGELADLSTWLGDRQDMSWLAAFDYVKAGPAGLSSRKEFSKEWDSLVNCLPLDVQPVAVAYADWKLAATICPAAIVDCVAGSRVSGLLLDTHHKENGLFDYLGIEEIEDLFGRVRQAGLWVAVAGSLSPETIPTAVLMNPDIIAVRGAVCDDGRTGTVNPHRIQRIADVITNASAADWQRS